MWKSFDVYISYTCSIWVKVPTSQVSYSMRGNRCSGRETASSHVPTGSALECTICRHSCHFLFCSRPRPTASLGRSSGRTSTPRARPSSACTMVRPLRRAPPPDRRLERIVTSSRVNRIRGNRRVRLPCEQRSSLVPWSQRWTAECLRRRPLYERGRRLSLRPLGQGMHT